MERLSVDVSERFLQAFLPMAVVALDGKCLEANEAMCRLLGRPRAQLRGRPLTDLCAGEQRRALDEALADAGRGGAGGQLPLVLRRGSTDVPVRLTWTLLRRDDGTPWYLSVVVVDETERVEAERALEAAQRRWRSLLAHASDVSWTADESGTVLSVTPSVTGLYGYLADDVVGRPMFSFTHPDSRQEAAALWRRVVSRESAKDSAEFRVALPDGTWRWVRVTLTDLRDDPWVGAIAGNLVDVTERREAEAAQAREQAWFRARFEQSGVPQAMIDMSGVLTHVNDALCRLVGRSREDLVGASLRTVQATDGTDGQIRELLAGRRESVQVERAVTGPDGAPVPVLVDVTLLRDEQGRPGGAAALLYDLSRLRETEQRHRLQEELFVALTRRAGDIAFVTSASGDILYASPSLENVLGYGVDEILATNGWDLVHPDDVQQAQATFRSVVDSGGSATFVCRIRARDGRWRWAQTTATNLFDTAVGGIVCNLLDVTERTEAEEALRASEARYRAITDAAEEGIWALTADGRTVYANARLGAILGVDLRLLYDVRLPALLEQRQVPHVGEYLLTREQRGPERYELVYPHPDGTDRWLWVSATPLPQEAGGHGGSLALISDITEVRRAERDLRHAALHDGLTGLPNRALLLDRLEHALARRGGSSAVLFVDLDHFKLVNDSRGHAAGDALLVAVASRIRQAVRAGDTVARFGGDEFVVVCEDVDDDADAVQRADSLLEVLSEQVDVEGEPIHVSASIGVAVAGPGSSASDVLRYADTAMYVAKESGRGRVRMFDPDLARQVEQRYRLAVELREALDVGSLALHFQPVIDLTTGRVLGMEALTRWHHPRRGAVEPSLFVALAASHGMSKAFDRWVVRTALAEAGAMHRDRALPEDAYVAVNVSAQNLGDSDLESLLVDSAGAAGIPPGQVVVEITESAIMNDTGAALALLGRLRDQGFGVSIDDFGTGYSSLAYLRDLPVSSLKIDRSFVAHVADDSDSLAITGSIVDLGRAVGLSVVGEGVETDAQAAVMRRLGCQAAQGWLWSPAVPSSDIRASGAWTRPMHVAPEQPAQPARAAPALAGDVRPEHGLSRLITLHRDGASLATIASALNREGYRTPAGQRWHRTSVARAITSSVYPALSAAEE